MKKYKCENTFIFDYFKLYKILNIRIFYKENLYEF